MRRIPSSGLRFLRLYEGGFKGKQEARPAGASARTPGRRPACNHVKGEFKP